MRAISTALMGGIVLVALAAPARPAAGAPASFAGTFTLAISDIATIQTTGSGLGASAGQGGTASVPQGAFTPSLVKHLSPPFLNSFSGLVVGATGLQGQFLAPVPTVLPPAQNGALSWTGSSGTTGFLGSAYLGAVVTPGCTSGCQAALSQAVPLGVVGVGGSTTMPVGPIVVTIHGNPWQLTSTTLTGGLLDTTTGTVPTPVVLVGSAFDNRDATGNGVLQIVTPVRIDLGAALGDVPALGIMTLDFSVAIPEPGLLALGGVGAAALLAMGRRQRTR